MRRAGHVTHMVERRGEMYTGFWWRNLRERGHFECPRVNGKLMLVS
jgi:hypothetical protein